MKKNNYLMMLGAALLLNLSMACTSDDADAKKEEGKVPVVEITPGHIVLSEGQQQMVAGSNAFAIKLLSEADRSYKGSYTLSPMSAGYVLGMLTNGGNDRFLSEASAMMGFGTTSTQAVNDYFATILQNAPHVDEDVTLEQANAIFANSHLGAKISSNFSQVMQDYYLASAESLDFSQEEQALARINGWCGQQTHQMITEIIKPSEFTPLSMAYLLNTIYFNAPWSTPFDKQFTKDYSFYADEGVLQVPMMAKKERMLYAENDEMQALCMPYSKGKFRMAVLLPREQSTTAQLISNLTAQSWQKLLADMHIETVDIRFPRFESSTEQDLLPLLTGMGLESNSLVNGFPAIQGNGGQAFNFNKIKQIVKLSVNEEGTKASAATATGLVTANEGEAQNEQFFKTFHAVRPFIYVIYEQETGAIFFMGKYVGQ